MSQRQQQDSLAIAQNGGVSSEEADLEAEADDLDDDMMDRISSSPSIEDGGYTSSMSTRHTPSPGAEMDALEHDRGGCDST